jgi:hypothetical protein
MAPGLAPMMMVPSLAPMVTAPRCRHVSASSASSAKWHGGLAPTLTTPSCVYLGANVDDVKPWVHFLKSFRQGYIWENLLKKGLKKRRRCSLGRPSVLRYLQSLASWIQWLVIILRRQIRATGSHVETILVLWVTIRSALVKEQYDTRLNEWAQTTKALDSIVHTVHDRHHWTNMQVHACVFLGTGKNYSLRGSDPLLRVVRKTCLWWFCRNTY